MLRDARRNANPAYALSQLSVANRDLGYIFSNPTHAVLMGTMKIIGTELPNFIRACKQYGLAKDMIELREKQIELFEKPPVILNLLDYDGCVYVASDSTLKARARAARVGKHCIEDDIFSHFKDSLMWRDDRATKRIVTVNIRGGATMEELTGNP